MSTTETPRCERCNTRVPEGGSLVLYRFRWSCDACRSEPDDGLDALRRLAEEVSEP